MNDANPVGTPLNHNVQIKPNPDGNQGSRSNSYVCLLGELQWIANVTRPDIAYAINKLTTYTTNPSLQHISILKHILCYLAGTKNLSITYSENPDHDQLSTLTLFHGYANAAYAKKQTTCALSSTEAEYVALSQASHELCWLRSLYYELGFP